MEWSKYNQYRKEVSSWLDFRRVPLTNRKSLELAMQLIPDNSKVLEIGANDRKFEKELQSRKKSIIYKSMDIDRHYKQDYYNIEEINEQFDFVVMFAVLEHLELEEARRYFKKISQISKKLIITTNNPFFPMGFFFDDVTHRQPYSPRTLYALLRLAGFEKINVFRISPSPFNFFKTFISYFTNLDFAPELFVYAIKEKAKTKSV